MNVWHQDDTFWEGAAQFIFSRSCCGQVPKDVDCALALLELPPGATVLDLPCGQGRHSLEFTRRGYRVTGADRTACYLAEARRKAEKESLEVEWIEADMRAFRRESTYAAVVNLFTSFGYFQDAADDVRVAEHFFASLKPGGRLLMDLMGKEVLARIFQEREWHQRDDGTLFLEERKVSQNWNWIDVRWIAVSGTERREYRFAHRLYSAGELVPLLTGVGFGPVTVFGSLKGAPYDDKAQRLVILAQKPE